MTPELSHTARPNRILLTLFMGVLMGALDIAIVGPALPALRAAFGIDDRAAAWVFAIYVLLNLSGAPLLARLSDRLGRRSIYILSVGLFACGSLLVALAPTFGTLLFGRAVQGLGAGGIFPVASAVIGDTFPPERRGRALGLVGAVFGLAFLLGPIAGGILLRFGWPWLFVINLPLAALVIALSLRSLPSTRPARRRPFDWPGMALLALLLAALAYGLNQIDSARPLASLASARVWPFLMAVALLAPALWRAERRAADPVLRPGLFATRQVALAAGLAAGAGLSEAAVVFVPALLVTTFEVTSSTASFMLAPVVLAMAVGAPISGRILDRLGSRVVALAGTGLTSGGMLLVGLFPASLALFYLAATLVGLGLAILLGSTLRYIMLNEAPPSERATAQSALSLCTSMGQLIGGALVGGIVASYGGAAGYAAAFLVVGAAMLALSVASLGLKGRAEERATAQRNHIAQQALLRDA